MAICFRDKFFSLNRLGRVPLKNIMDSGEVYEIIISLG